MKKHLLTLLALCLILVAFTSPKSYKIELNEQEANTLLYVIDKSSAEHTTVKAIQEIVYKQLQVQVDTARKK